MMAYRQTADASQVYRQNAAAKLVRLVSSAVSGNLADVSKNNTVVVETIVALATIPTEPSPSGK